MAKFTPRQETKRMERRLARLKNLLLTAMNRTLPQIRRIVLSQHMNAAPRPTRTAVRKQSGKLRKSVTYTKARPGLLFGAHVAFATFSISARFAGVHVGKRGQKTRMTAKRGNLAIPTRFARKASGVPIGKGPRDPRFNITHTRRVGPGTKVMFGTRKGKAGILPLFTLKKSVMVPVRIDTNQDIVKPAQALYKQQVQAGLPKALR